MTNKRRYWFAAMALSVLVWIGIAYIAKTAVSIDVDQISTGGTPR